MTTNLTTPGYSHTQTGPLCLILYASALLCFALAVGIDDTPGLYIAVAVGGVLALLGPAVHHLTVEDRGDRLASRFGPLPLLGTLVRYADIVKVEVGRTLRPGRLGRPLQRPGRLGLEPVGPGLRRRQTQERRAADRHGRRREPDPVPRNQDRRGGT